MMKRMQLGWAAIFALGFVFGALTISALVFGALTLRGAPVEWSQSVYEPVNDLTCPGEPVTIVLGGEFQGDGVTATFRAYRHADTGRSAHPVIGPDYKLAREGFIEADFPFPIPDALEPGEYTAISWTCYAFDGQGCKLPSAAAYEVPFTILEDCE